MNFKNFFGYVTAILLIVSAIWYSYLIIIGDIKPVVATFILAFVYFSISEATYWANNRKVSIWNNIAMHAGFLNVSIATFTLIGKRLWDGNLVADFNSFHFFCLGLSGIILIIWKLKKNPKTSFLLMQLVAVIAYLPMIFRVLKADTQTESNIMWVAILIASMTAIPKVLSGYKEQKDWLGFVYIGRVIPSNLLLVYLIFAKDYGLYPFV